MTRRLQLGCDGWTYQIGRKFAVLWNPQGVKTVVSFENLIGREEVEKRKTDRKKELEESFLENNYRGFSITPSDIHSYIEKMSP